MNSKLDPRSSQSDGQRPSRYLPPQGVLRRLLHEIYIVLAYDVWRRQLQTRGGWRPDAAIRVLECGSGPGLLLKLIGRWFSNASTFGLNLDPSLISVAREETPRSHFIQASAQEIPFEDRSFDLIFALHVTEHLPHPDHFVVEARRVLKSRGGGLSSRRRTLGASAHALWDDIGTVGPMKLISIFIHPPIGEIFSAATVLQSYRMGLRAYQAFRFYGLCRLR